MVSCSISIAGLELWARTQVSLSALRFVSDDGRPFVQPDSQRKYRLTPGFHGFQVATEFRKRIDINRLGFRGEEPDELRSRPVFFLGDSFAFGVGAAGDETIPARLQEVLGGVSGSGPRIWNLGVPGYSFQQYAATYRNYRALVEPAGVVLTALIMSGPSRADDLLGAHRFAVEQRSGQDWSVREVEDGTYQKPLRRWLKENSALTAVVLTHLAPAIRRLEGRYRSSGSPPGRDVRREYGWEVAAATIGSLKRELAEAGAWLVIVHIPAQADLGVGHERFARRLEAIAEAHGAIYVDGGRALRGEADLVYWPLDGHLTPAGNLRLARHIAGSIPTSGTARALPALP